MTLTGDTITDEQIRGLRDSLPIAGPHFDDDERVRWMCGCALGDPGYSASARISARARCAEILNQRRR